MPKDLQKDTSKGDSIENRPTAAATFKPSKTLFAHYGKTDGYEIEDFKSNMASESFRSLVRHELSTLSRALANPYLKAAANPEEHEAYLRYYIKLCRMLFEFYDEKHNSSLKAKDVQLAAGLKKDLPDMDSQAAFHDIDKQLAKPKKYTDDKAIGLIGLAHFYRLFATFATLVMQYFWDLDTGNPAPSQDYLQAQNIFFHGLSVALPLLRLILTAKHLIQHHEEMTRRDIQLKSLQIMGDVVWGLANLCTNFYQQLHLFNGSIFLFPVLPSLPIVGLVTAGFLLYDIAHGLIEWFFIERPAIMKDSLELNARMEALIQTNKAGSNDFEIQMVRAQLIEIQAQAAERKFAIAFTGLALSLITAGFAASLIFSAGMSLPLCYAALALGLALCRPAGAFGAMVGEHRRVNLWAEKLPEKAGPSEKNALLGFHKNKRDVAEANFFNSLKAHVLIPGLFIAVMAISWQASLVVLAALLIGMAVQAWIKPKQSDLNTSEGPLP